MFINMLCLSMFCLFSLGRGMEPSNASLKGINLPKPTTYIYVLAQVSLYPSIVFVFVLAT